MPHARLNHQTQHLESSSYAQGTEKSAPYDPSRAIPPRPSESCLNTTVTTRQRLTPCAPNHCLRPAMRQNRLRPTVRRGPQSAKAPLSFEVLWYRRTAHVDSHISSRSRSCPLTLHAERPIVQGALFRAGIPSSKEPPGLCLTDGEKRPDGMTLIPWRTDRCLVWDAPHVFAHHSACSRSRHKSSCSEKVYKISISLIPSYLLVAGI